MRLGYLLSMDKFLDTALIVDRKGYEKEDIPQIWTPSELHKSLIQTTVGRDLPENAFPTREIHLSHSMHEALNLMRERTQQELREVYAPVGFVRDTLCMPIDPVVADVSSVSFETIQEVLGDERISYFSLTEHRDSGIQASAIAEAIVRNQIEDFVGDFHSHPAGAYDDTDASLSLLDLHSLLQPTNWPMMGVVDGNYNILAFRTQRSQHTTHLSPEYFAQSWARKGGFIYENRDGKTVLRPKDEQASLWETNRMIAKRHNVILYKGRVDEPLLRARDYIV